MTKGDDLTPKGQVRRMVRKKTSSPRTSKPARTSWACVRAATGKDEPLAVGYSAPPRKVYARTTTALRKTYVERDDQPLESPRFLTLLWEKGSTILARLRRAGVARERRGLIALILGIGCVAFAGGIAVQHMFDPAIWVMAYIATGQVWINQLLTPATRSTVIAGGILVAIGLWLVVQMLRKPAAPANPVSRGKPVIPKEMLDRHA